ncbi:MAG TPA: hypothetical protein VMW15_09140 [Terracidiphilus sp.]|nr:hypothetical protein [Terracidiphilus sp.]
MKIQINNTLAAPIVAVIAGLIAWFTGISSAMLPPHPFLGTLLITVFTGIAVFQIWHFIAHRKKTKP